MPGLGTTGFEIKRQPEIIADLTDAQKAVFGEDLVLDPSSPDAQFNGLMSDQFAALWELGLQLYSGLDPRTAGGLMLDRLASIAGIVRQQAFPSTASVLLLGTVGAVIPAGTIFSAPTIPGVKFSLNAEVTVDVSGSVIGEVTADVQGAILVAKNTITKIETPISGLSSVTNPTAGNIGIDRETDEELRRRRANSVGLAATSMVSSIYSSVANLAGVTNVKLYENTDTIPDANGVPAHSMALYVRGGVESEIASAIALKRSAGCGLSGDITSLFTDSNGFTHTIKFSRPTDVPVYIQITAVKTPTWDINANARITQAIVDYASGTSLSGTSFLGFDISEDVYSPQLVYGLAEEGSILVQQILVGSSAPASLQVLDIAFNEIPTFNIANVEIVYV